MVTIESKCFAALAFVRVHRLPLSHSQHGIETEPWDVCVVQLPFRAPLLVGAHIKNAPQNRGVIAHDEELRSEIHDVELISQQTRWPPDQLANGAASTTPGRHGAPGAGRQQQPRIALHLANEAQNYLLVENPGIRFEVHQIVRCKPVVGELERTLNQIHAARVKGSWWTPDEGIFEVSFLLRAGASMGYQEWRPEIQLEDL